MVAGGPSSALHKSQTNAEPAIAGDSVKFSRLSPAIAGSGAFFGSLTWGLRPRLYAYACYRRLKTFKS